MRNAIYPGTGPRHDRVILRQPRVLSLLALCCAVAMPDPRSVSAASGVARPRPAIFDTDIGTDIDDTWALAYLLNCPELDLKLVVTDTADTVYRARIVARFLTVAQRTDVAVGVGLRGQASNEFQKPWVEARIRSIIACTPSWWTVPA